MKKIMIVFLIAAALFLASCISTDKTTGSEYRTGTQGIVADFLTASQKQLFFEGDFLNLVLDVKNKGVFADYEGFVIVSGYDPNAIFIGEVKKTIPMIEPKSAYLPEGGSELLEFKESRQMKVPYGSSYKPIIIASSCYTYQTKAALKTCVIPNYNEYIRGDTVCMPAAAALDSQGAPVAVVSVDETASPTKIQYLITLKNVGNGQIIKKDRTSECPFNLGVHDIDEAVIKVEVSALGEVMCENDNRIKFFEGSGRAVCTIDITPADKKSYETEMEITVDYGYTSSISREIEIINPAYITEE